MDDIIPDPQAINAQLIADATNAAIDTFNDHDNHKPPIVAASSSTRRVSRAKTKIILAKLFKFPVVGEDSGACLKSTISLVIQQVLLISSSCQPAAYLP